MGGDNPLQKNIPAKLLQQAENCEEEKQLPEVNIPTDETAMPQAEASIAAQPEIVNFKPETSEEMEVHHHSHAHGKKNWKTYVWEFFMLFLAVFCGFLAEYQLEHVIEHNREKEYIHSLLADLETDKQTLEQQTLHVKSTISMMDSMITFLNNPSLITANSGQLYYQARMAPRFETLSINSRTFEQLKNSGNFRLIKNIGVSNKIMAYYEKLPLIRQIESIYNDEFNEYKKLAAKVFDPGIFKQMESDNQGINRTNDNPPLRTTDNELLKELSVFSIYMNGSRKGILDAEDELKNSGAELIAFLKTEYTLEKE